MTKTKIKKNIRKKGEVVIIKNKTWYNSKKNKQGFIETGICGFNKDMTEWCGCNMTIAKVVKDTESGEIYYKMIEDNGRFSWDSNMFN